MSVMSDMLADVLKKSLPPEVMAMLTPENMQAFKNNAEALVMELRSGIANCQSQNTATHATLDNIVEKLAVIMERTENDGRDGNRKPRARSGNSGSGDTTS